MKTSIRYGILILLMVSIALPLILSAFSNIHQAWIRHEMLERLERRNLHTISLSPGEVVWYKKEKEIIINNRMFDVKSWKNVDGKIIFQGLYDEEETAFLKKVKEQTSDTQNSRHVIKAYQLESSWIAEEASFYTSPILHFSYLSYREVKLPMNSATKDTPPPRCILI